MREITGDLVRHKVRHKRKRKSWSNRTVEPIDTNLGSLPIYEGASPAYILLSTCLVIGSKAGPPPPEVALAAATAATAAHQMQQADRVEFRISLHCLSFKDVERPPPPPLSPRNSEKLKRVSTLELHRVWMTATRPT